VIRSIPLGVTPTAREAQTILGHLEGELRTLGAHVERTPYGAIRFRFPGLLKARHLGLLNVVSTGRATMGAAAGEPWRLRYELKFTSLYWITIFLSIAAIAIGIRSGRFVIFYTLVGVWTVAFFLPYLAASLRFRSLVERLVREVSQRVYTPVPPEPPAA
jgi:ABC-type Na+ efflux pump permease subunit